MTTFTKISDLDVTSTLTDNDKFIVETATGTKACTRSALREETQITPEDIGLGNVDNTSDLDKPISTATQAALNSCLQSATAATVYLTQTEAGSVYETKTNASGTYLSKTDAATYYETKVSAGSTYVSKTEASTVYATKTEVGSMLPSATAATVYATKTELSSMLPSATAATVYATKTEASSLLPSATAATVYATKTEALENVTTNTYTVLTTTTKSVLGAINEVNGLLAGVETLLSQI